MVDQVKQASEQAGQAAEGAKGTVEGAAQQAAGSISGELRNLGRDVTMEALKVLTPAAKQAAERAAQELVSRAPGLVKDYGTRLVGRAGAATLGGVTGTAKGVLKTGAGAAGGVLSRLRPGGRDGKGGKKGGPPSGTGRGRRLPIQASVDVGVPIESAYAQWTQFEEFPKFMFRTERLEHKDDTHLEWHSKIWGIRRTWEAEISEQRPRERIAWRATSGANHVGVITFHPLAHNLTRVQVNLDFQPTGVLEKFGSGVRATRRAVQSDLMRFKALIEMREQAQGEWPGTIKEGEVVEGEQQPEAAAPEEPAAQEPAAEEPAAEEPAPEEPAQAAAQAEPGQEQPAQEAPAQEAREGDGEKPAPEARQGDGEEGKPEPQATGTGRQTAQRMEGGSF